MSLDAAAVEQFGPYLVYERLGVGGMATVHRALEHGAEGFERVVALKRLLPHLAEDASFIKSFVREAKLASFLNHVNIVQIYELGRVGTEYFISMEYIEGRDLRRILRHARGVTGPPPINITVALAMQLCDALDYAHTKVGEDGHPLGLVHRDISPSNLLITKQGHLKIIDFGIAKAHSSQLRTQTGRVKGKLAYMAPEAVSGSRDLDARSDIWACGVILHELLTARPLFASKNEYQTLLKVQRGDIMPPSTFNNATPPELDAIVFRALAREIKDRYASAAELRDALLDVKLKNNLATGNRDIASWLDWAFGLELPGDNMDSSGSSGVMSPKIPKRASTPRPVRVTEEDEAVEIVWGGGQGESEVGPVVLEEVPDVSGKHRVRRETGDPEHHSKDILTPPPSQGTMPSIYGAGGTGERDVEVIARGGAPARAITTPKPDENSARVRKKPHTIPRNLAGLRLVPEQQARVVTEQEKPTDRYPAQAGPAQLLGAPTVNERIGLMTGNVTTPFRATTEPGFAKEQKLIIEPKKAPALVIQEAKPTPTKLRTAVRVDPRIADATKPGFAPARAATVARAQSPSKSPASVRIGESIAARAVKPRRMWLFLLGSLVLAGGAAAFVMVVSLATSEKRATGETSQAPRAPRHTTGTVKFVLEPTDAEIKIAGKLEHAGSPWATELAEGVHQIEIRRSGYKAWLTSIELSARETQTLRVVLEPLTAATGGSGGDASLMISTTPSGLEVSIDGKPQAQRTPFKGKLEVGTHKITLSHNGVEVWQQTLEAEASSDYEFNPSFTAEKQRVRAVRGPSRSATTAEITPTTAPSAESADEKIDHQDPPPTWNSPASPSADSSAPTGVAAAAAPNDTAPTAPTPPTTSKPNAPEPGTTTTTPGANAPGPKLATPIPGPQKGPVAAAATTDAQRTGPPPIVAPTAVKKLSGDTPSVAKFHSVELPSALAAKVCIDEGGRVTSADMVSKVERRVASDLTDQLLGWRYAPYRANGAAIPACFVVTFRAK